MDDRVITFTALVPEKTDQDLVLELLIGEINTRPSKEVKMSLRLEEVKHYYECPEYSGLTRLITTDGQMFIVNEEWEMFDWRYKQENDQDLKTWKDYYLEEANLSIRTYCN